VQYDTSRSVLLQCGSEMMILPLHLICNSRFLTHQEWEHFSASLGASFTFRKPSVKTFAMSVAVWFKACVVFGRLNTLVVGSSSVRSRPMFVYPFKAQW
jgi:hypothetical protein